MIARLLLMLALLAAPLGLAQTGAVRELELAKALFDAGNYAQAAEHVKRVLAATNFSNPQRIELHQIAGLSRFNLGDTLGAKESFLALLRLNPDFVMDPFVAPPPAIKLFEQVKRDNTDELVLVRQLLKVQAEQDRRAEEERKRLEAERAERRIVTIDRRPLWMNFLPFGAGQFLQERTEWGITFAVSEGVLAVTSIVAFFAIEGLKTNITEIVSDRATATGTFQRTFRAIPQSAEAQRDAWRIVKFSTGGAFYLTWALGLIDALVHHTGDRVRESREPSLPRAAFQLTPLPGGAFGSFTLTF